MPLFRGDHFQQDQAKIWNCSVKKEFNKCRLNRSERNWAGAWTTVCLCCPSACFCFRTCPSKLVVAFLVCVGTCFEARTPLAYACKRCTCSTAQAVSRHYMSMLRECTYIAGALLCVGVGVFRHLLVSGLFLDLGVVHVIVQ